MARLDRGVPAPSYAQEGDAGADLATRSDVTIEPGERAVVATGIALGIPAGYAGFVHPRSGLAARLGLSVLNAPGTIDSGYRGEIKVCLVNHDRNHAVALRRGDRIAQLVVQRVESVEFVEVPAEAGGAQQAGLPPSTRGAGGYGSTGGHAALTAVGDAAERRTEI